MCSVPCLPFRLHAALGKYRWSVTMHTHIKKKWYSQLYTTSNSHCLKASLDARSTVSSFDQRDKSRSYNFTSQRKRFDWGHMQMSSWIAGYVLHDKMAQFPRSQTCKFSQQRDSTSFSVQTCHIPKTLNLKEKGFIYQTSLSLRTFICKAEICAVPFRVAGGLYDLTT